MVAVRGDAQLAALGRRLKEAGEDGGTLRREMLAAIRDATELLPEELVASALNTLPQRGGLAARVATSKITRSTRLSARRAGVTIKAEHKDHINSMDKGHVRHPLFGDRKHWYTEAVKPGWWTRPIEASGPRSRERIQEAMQRTKEAIERL